MSLTHGAVRTLFSSQSQNANPNFQPILQLIQLKQVQTPQGNPGAGDRFRAIVSDGEHYVQGMLATQLNHLVHSKQLNDNCLVKVEDFMNNQVQGRTVIILLTIQVISNPGQRFGTPQDIEKANLQPQAPPVLQSRPMYDNTNSNSQSNQGSSNPFGGAPQPVKSGGGGAPGRNPYGGSGGGGSGSGGSNPYSGGSRYGTPSQPVSSAPIVRTPTSVGVNGQPLTPISQLNMYQNRWTIRGRITTKTDIRTWSNAKGEGSLFSIEILDNSGQDIKATFFKEAVDKFHPMIEMNKVYTFSGGRLKTANPQWNNCKSQLEITFDQNSEIHLDNDTGDIQQQMYELVKIAALEHTEADKSVDILAIVKNVEQPATLLSKKTGKELIKCDLTLVDDTGVEINLTVWNEKATKAPVEYANAPVVAFRRLRVSDYGGKSLSTTISSSEVVNPNLPEVGALRQWWASVGSQGGGRSLSSSVGGGRMESFADRKTISAIKQDGLGHDMEKADWISFKGTFNFLKKDKDGGAWYTACANADEPCKNRYKATETPDGSWHCEKCQQTRTECVRRWIFSGTVTDDTCTTWVSIFNEQAENMFEGATADMVYKTTFEENFDQDAYDSYFVKACFKDWIFKCKVKSEQMGDETRVKVTVYQLHPVDYVKESKDLLAAIAAF